jgi:hypothetical protein
LEKGDVPVDAPEEILDVFYDEPQFRMVCFRHTAAAGPGVRLMSFFLSTGGMFEPSPKLNDFSVEGFGERHRRFQEDIPPARSGFVSALVPVA